jgi:hypothetical protein
LRTINCLARLMAVAGGAPPQVMPDNPSAMYLQLLLAHQRLPPNPILEMRLAAVLDRVHRPTADRPDIIPEWMAEQLAAPASESRAPGHTRQTRAAAG